MGNHGKLTVFKLDDLAGAPQDISGFFRSASGLKGLVDRPATTSFGDNAARRGLSGLKDGGPISLAGLLRQAAGTSIHGKSVRIALDQYALQGKLRSLTIRRGVDLPNTEQFGATWRERDAVGHLNAGCSFGGLWKGAANEIGPIFEALFESETPGLMSVGYGGFTIGNLVDLIKPCLGNYRISSPHDNLSEVSAEAEADDQCDLGVSLHDFTAETTAGTTNFGSVDETASTTAGAVAHLHISAFSGFTNIVVKVQHSVDNSAWSDLLTFAAATGATKERLEVASGTTINRYVRGSITFTGAGPGSCTLQISFARRSYTYGTAGTYRHLAGLYGRSASSTFEYGPEGGAAGKPKFSGECRLSSLQVDLRHDDLLQFSQELAVTGAVAVGTF